MINIYILYSTCLQNSSSVRNGYCATRKKVNVFFTFMSLQTFSLPVLSLSLEMVVAAAVADVAQTIGGGDG